MNGDDQQPDLYQQMQQTAQQIQAPPPEAAPPPVAQIQPPAPQPPPPPQPKPYYQVMDEYNRMTANHPVLHDMPMQEWAENMNTITGTNQYDEGLHTNRLRNVGANIDIALKHFGGAPYTEEQPAGTPWYKATSLSQALGYGKEGFDIPAAFHKAGTSVAEHLGADQGLAEKIGGMAETFPFTGAAIGLSALTGPAAPYTAGSLFGLHTYGETGAVLPSLISAATPRILQETGGLGGQIALRGMGARTAGELDPELLNLASSSNPLVAKYLARLVPSGASQMVTEYLGKQAGMFLGLQGAGVAETLADPRKTWEQKLAEVGESFKPSSLIAGAVGLAPFALMDLWQKGPSPLETVQKNVEGQFTDQFTKKWAEDRVVPPSQQEIQEGIDRAKKGPPAYTPEPKVPVDPQEGLFATSADVKKATDLAEQRAGDPVGEVLKSMGQAPVLIDQKELEVPVIATDKAWPMTGPTGAMETVRSRANDMLVAQGATTVAGEGFGSGHDQTLYSVIRGVEAQGKGAYSSDDIAQISAARMADVWQRDKADLKVGGYRPSGEYPAYPFARGLGPDAVQRKFEENNAVMEEVARRISPAIPSDKAVEQAKASGGVIPPGTGVFNPDYDPKLNQMIAFISGDEEHWLQAGIPQDVMQSVWQDLQRGEAKLPTTEETRAKLEAGEATSDIVTKSKRVESGLPANIIDIVSNLGPKMYEKIRVLEDAIQEEVAKNGFFTTNTHNEMVKSATTPGEAAIPSDYNSALESLQQQLMHLIGLDKAVGQQRARGGVAPLADITAEAYKAALRYTKEFDITKPDTVSDFVRYIRGVIKTQEANWSRVRAGESFVTDPQGNTLTPESREGALALAKRLQDAADAGRGGDYEVRYTVPQEPEADKKFRVVESRYINIFSMPERMGQGDYREGEERQETRLPSQGGVGTVRDLEETTEKAEQARPLQERLTSTEGMSFDELQNEYFSKRFMALGRISDPAEREARKGALAANAVDFINAMKNSDFAKVITDETGAKKISDIAELKQKFIRYIQFMLYGGQVDVVKLKTGFIGVGNLEAFNNFMRGAGLGYGDYGPDHRHAGEPRLYKWNEEQSGANFFEKWRAFSEYMGQRMIDPRTREVNGERRPDGDYGFYSPMIGEKMMNKVDVPWANLKAEGAPVQRLKAASEKFPDLLYSRLGNTFDFATKYDNPLADLMVRSTENDLFSRAHKVVDLFERFGNVDPTDLAVAKLWMKNPFVRNQHVGFSMSAEDEVRGYFHTDGVINSGGVLVDPYKPATGGRVELRTPRESFRDFLEELSHSGVDFAFNSDLKFAVKDEYLRDQLLSFRDEATAIHKFLVEHREDTKALLGDQFVIDNLMHPLKDPREMLAQVMSNANFRTWLATVQDTMDHPLPAELGFGTNMFQRLWNLIKRVFDHILGPDASNTMLNRLAQVSTRGAQLQDRMRLINTPDIYNFLYQEHRLNVERLESLRGQPVPKPVEPTQVFRQFETKPPEIVGGPKGPIRLETDPLRQSLLEEISRAEMELSFARGMGFTGSPAIAGYAKPTRPGEGRPRVTIGLGAKQAQDNLDYARRRLDIYDKYQGEPIPQNINWQINDIDSAMADTRFMLSRAQMYGERLPGLVQRYQSLIQELQGSRDMLTQIKAERLPGAVLESRGQVNPQNVYDSISSAATHMTEDLKGDIWIKPYDMSYIRRVLGPLLGAKLRLDFNGSQMGYKFNVRDLDSLTHDDVARMPPPIVRPWAPSLWESMKSLFKSDGSNNQTAEAQANLMLQHGSLLRGSDRATWGTSPFLRGAAGLAWMPNKYVGLAPNIFNTFFAGPQEVIRHESAHVSGFTSEGRFNSEPPDVQRDVRRVYSMFDAMSMDQRKGLLWNLAQTSHEDFGSSQSIQSAAITKPQEFAANWMGHIGDMLGTVPDPSVYLKNQMRFVPDEMSDLLKTTTWRRLQGLDRLEFAIKNAHYSRGFKDELVPVMHDLVGIFKGLARSGLEIAEDVSEFQRSRLIFPDQYKGLLQQMADAQLDFFTRPEVAEGLQIPRIPGEALESRMPPAIEKMVRNFFPLPTSDGQLPRKLSIWDRGLTQFSQLAAKYPAARSFYDMLATSRAISQITRIKMMTALAGAYQGGKVLDDVRTQHVADFIKSPQLREQFSKIALDLNFMGDTTFDKALGAANNDVEAMPNPEQLHSWLTPQYVNGLMDKYGVPADKRDVIRTIMEGTRNQIKQTRDNIVASHQHALMTMVAKVVSLNGDLNPEQSRKAAETLRQALALQDANPDAAMQKMLQFHAEVKNPEVFQRVFDLAQSGWQSIEKLDRFLELRAPYYMSERRPGGFGLIYKDATGKVRSQYYATGADRNKAILSKGLTEADLVRQVNPQDRNYGIDQSVFGMLDEVHNRIVEKLTPLFGEEQAKQLGQVLDYANELRNSLNARDVLRTTTGRELAPGREELDMFAAHQHYLNATTAAIRNRFIKLESELLFTDPSFNNQPFLKDHIKGHIDAVLQPDGRIGQTIQQLSFLHYLWGNVSSMIMQLSHQVMGLAPMLTARGASVAGSYGTLKDANLAAMDARGWFGGGKGYADKEIGQMVERAKAEGVITSWIARELDHAQDLSMVNRMRVTQGMPQWKSFDLLKNGLYQGYSLVRRLYDLVPIYNSEVAFVAALMHLRSDAYTKFNGGTPLTGEALYQEARFLKDNTMFPGGKENRPGMFQYVPRSAAQAFWSLQTYANGLTTMMGEFVRRSINPPGAGLTPAQGAQVRKAAAQMLITQLAITGVMGMPFGTTILYALQKLFPDHDVEDDVRKTLANLAGDDGALGQSLSSIMMNGLPNSFTYGPDVGSRFALSGVFHVSPYSGVGWQQLTGPIGGIMSNAFQGAQAGLRGDPMETVEDLMPVGFKRIWDTVSQGQQYKAASGKVLVNDLSPEEIAARLIGFRPARVARIEDLQTLTKTAEAAEKSEQANWTSKQVQMLQSGRDAEVQQNIAKRVSDKHGVYPAKHYADVIAQEYANQNMPVDLRRFGNRATILAQKSLRGVLGGQTEGPGEQERLQMQQQVAQRLGLGGATAGRWRHAGNVDALMRMYPHLTTSQANLLLTRAAGSRPPPDLSAELQSAGE